MIEKVITYKQQGDGRDTWEIKEFQDGTMINSYMVDERPEGHADTIEQAYEIVDERFKKRTRELILEGFTFDNHKWSLSDNAQRNWANLINAKDDKFPYPMFDQNLELYVLQLNKKWDFYYAAFDTVELHVKSEVLLRQQIRQLQTIEQVLNFIDPR